MGKLTEVRVPDIGDFENVDVVEVFVEPGTHVEAEQSLITIESEKASLEIPAPAAGTVREVKVAVGDKVSEGTLIVTLEIDEERGLKPPAEQPPESPFEKQSARPQVQKPPAHAPQITTREHDQEEQKKEKPEATARERPGPPSETGHVPPGHSPQAAVVPPARGPQSDDEDQRPSVAQPLQPRPAPLTPPAPQVPPLPHASPSVRRFARELGVDLGQVTGSGPKGRILQADVQAYVKARVAPSAPSAFTLPPIPKVDFAKFGEIQVVPLSKVNRLTARNVHRSWLHIPHVTHFDEADITDLEEFRQANQKEAEAKGFKLTLLAFLLKACAGTLKELPRFNASLDETGEQLILKKFINIGVAVDTPEGLVVPVIRGVDTKGIFELAAVLAEVSSRARAGKLTPADVQGGTFSISSLGGIGGTAFTPIVNAPEVAILGVARASTKPVYRDGQLVPRLILPLCLSYDHRVIDGAAAARFTRHLASLLADLRRLAL